MLRGFALLLALVPFAPALASAQAQPVTPTTRPESGHLALVLGGFVAGEPGALSLAPNARAELAFNVIGPIAAGGYFETQLGSGDRFAVGGGLLFTVRPDVPTFPLQPHFELSGGRLQMPGASQAMLDAWSVSLGGGLGVPVARDVAIEARVRHTWLFGLPSSASTPDAGWTIALAVAVDLR
jgi:hypothetical protein